MNWNLVWAMLAVWVILPLGGALVAQGIYMFATAFPDAAFWIAVLGGIGFLWFFLAIWCPIHVHIRID